MMIPRFVILLLRVSDNESFLILVLCFFRSTVYTYIRAVSQRGVVFFRNQNINSDEQKTLVQKLGVLTGKPSTSGVSCYLCTLLHVFCVYHTLCTN